MSQTFFFSFDMSSRPFSLCEEKFHTFCKLFISLGSVYIGLHFSMIIETLILQRLCVSFMVNSILFMINKHIFCIFMSFKTIIIISRVVSSLLCGCDLSYVKASYLLDHLRYLNMPIVKHAISAWQPYLFFYTFSQNLEFHLIFIQCKFKLASDQKFPCKLIYFVSLFLHIAFTQNLMSK